jgi:hypothetical protein
MGLRQPKLERSLGALVECFDVGENCRTCFGSDGEKLTVDDFVFETAPERFDERVVVTIAFPAAVDDGVMQYTGLHLN